MKDFKHSGSKVLLTEGKNDCHVIASLCKQHNIPQNFGLYDCESDKNAIKRLAALIAGAEPIETIGIVIDADNPNLKAKWDSIKDRLQKFGYTIPKAPSIDGTILSIEGKPKIGIWLMPDNLTDGMLEDFCKNLLSTEAVDFASKCVEDAKNKNFSTFIDNHHSKAVIHTFLAWQDEPGMPLGQAITAKVLNGSNPLALAFVDFLKNLF